MQSMRKKGPSLELWIVLAVLSAAFIAELYRVKGFLLLDLLAPLLLAVWLLKKWLKKEPGDRRGRWSISGDRGPSQCE